MEAQCCGKAKLGDSGGQDRRKTEGKGACYNLR